MWCPEGYLTLSEVSDRIASSSFHRLTPSDEELKELEDAKREDANRTTRWSIDTGDFFGDGKYIAWLMRAFVELFQSEIRAATPSATVLRLTGAFFYQAEIWDEYGEYDYSQFPTSRAAREIAARWDFQFICQESLRVCSSYAKHPEVRHIVNFPLCIKADHVPDSGEKLIDLIIERKAARGASRTISPSPNSIRIAEKIISMYRAGEISTKKQAFDLFGKGQKVEVWRSIWREVTKAYPEAATPGPRRR